MSPMERTLQWLREHGYEADKAERVVPRVHTKQDLFGFIDVMAVSDTRLLALQVTDVSHRAAMVKKVMAQPVARLLAYHMEIEVWSWGKQGPRGEKKQWVLHQDKLTSRLLPKNSLLRRKIESGEWPTHTLD